MTDTKKLETSPSPESAAQTSVEIVQQSFPQVVCAEDIRKLTGAQPKPHLVENLIKPGVFILAGAPKRGKSTLASQIAYGVSTGTKVGGAIPTLQSEVLFISLEETKAQLNQKLDSMAGETLLTGLHLAFEWKKAPRGGLVMLDAYLAQNPAVKLVIIDIWGKFQGEVKSGGRSYHGEYKALEPVRELSKRHDVAILLLHHENKSGGKDWMKNLYGSNALTGAVDGVMLLDRESPTSPDAVLHAVGRDIPAQDWSLEFDLDKICWTFGRKPLANTPEQQALLDYLSGCNGPQRLTTIYDANKCGSKSNAQKLLSRLEKSGLVVKPSWGTYELSGRARRYYRSETPVDSVDTVETSSAVQSEEV